MLEVLKEKKETNKQIKRFILLTIAINIVIDDNIDIFHESKSNSDVNNSANNDC